MTFTCNNTLNEGWCETLPHIRIHLMKGGVRLWCATLHHIRIHFMKGGVRLWCETLHHIRIQSVKGGVRLWCETLHQGWPRVWGGSRSTNPCVFPCKVASAGDERYLLCAAVAAALLCVQQRVVVPVRIVLCVSWSCGCRSHWNGCMNVAWAMFWGGSRTKKPLKFFGVKWLRPAVKGTSFMCAAGASAVVRDAIGSSSVLERVVVSVCVVLRVSWICGCRSHCDGCMIVVIWCCHACGEMQVCYRMLRNVYCNGCMNVARALFWGGSRSTKPCIFPCKVASAGDERYLVCVAGAGSSSVFCNEWLCRCA